jgi:hypothetical protein
MKPPGPQTPAHTPTPVRYQYGALKRDPNTMAVAVRNAVPTAGDGTLDWGVTTVNYGGWFASWDDVSAWNDLYAAFFVGGGALSVTIKVVPVYPAKFVGGGALSATVQAQ